MDSEGGIAEGYEEGTFDYGDGFMDVDMSKLIRLYTLTLGNYCTSVTPQQSWFLKLSIPAYSLDAKTLWNHARKKQHLGNNSKSSLGCIVGMVGYVMDEEIS